MKKLNLVVGMGILALALGAVFAFTNAPNNSTSVAGGIEVGQIAPDFNLKNIDGEMMSLESFKDNKGVILVFTCNTCPYSVAYEDRLLGLDEKYREMGYPVVAINPNDVIRKPGDSFDKMIERHAEKGFTFPYLYDQTQEIAMTYGATKTPHVFVLAKGNAGKFRVAYIGAIDDAPMNASSVEETYVQGAIAAIEAGTLPDPSSVKAIGCTIKWKQSE